MVRGYNMQTSMGGLYPTKASLSSIFCNRLHFYLLRGPGAVRRIPQQNPEIACKGRLFNARRG